LLGAERPGGIDTFGTVGRQWSQSWASSGAAVSLSMLTRNIFVESRPAPEWLAKMLAMKGATTPATVRIIRTRIPRVTCRLRAGGAGAGGSFGASGVMGAAGSSSMAIARHGTAGLPRAPQGPLSIGPANPEDGPHGERHGDDNEQQRESQPDESEQQRRESPAHAGTGAGPESVSHCGPPLSFPCLELRPRTCEASEKDLRSACEVQRGPR